MQLGTSRPLDNTQRRNAVNLQVHEARDKLSAERDMRRAKYNVSEMWNYKTFTHVFIYSWVGREKRGAAQETYSEQ